METLSRLSRLSREASWYENDDHEGDTGVSRIQENIDGLHIYTIEATTLNPEETGGFTLTVADATLTPTTGDCVETIAVGGTASEQWAPGCESETRSGSHARYYTFTLDQQSDLTINLESDAADTYLYLRSGNAQSGSHLYENDDHNRDTSISQIQETLEAGDLHHRGHYLTDKGRRVASPSPSVAEVAPRPE